MNSSKKINIAIVDDAPMRLDGMVSNLLKTGKINVVGTSLNEKSFLKLCADNEYILDVLLMDKNIERSSHIGDLAFIKKVREEFPNQKIIVYTWNYFVEHITPLKQIKVNGYLHDDFTSATLLKAINTVFEGDCCFPKMNVSKPGKGNELDISFIKMVTSLSLGQYQVAEYLADDLLNHQIAKKMGITVGAIDVHIRYIYEKLEISPKDEQPRSKFMHTFGEYFRRS